MNNIFNIVIGKPIVSIESLIAKDHEDWIVNEKDHTFFTENRYLPSILKEAGIVPSVSEVKRNKPALNITLNSLDCFWIKWGKKKVYIIVGE